jgi:transcriptional regulator with XRE-family HTH domain
MANLTDRQLIATATRVQKAEEQRTRAYAERDAAIARAVHEGRSQTEVAKLCGVTKMRVSQIMRVRSSNTSPTPDAMIAHLRTVAKKERITLSFGDSARLWYRERRVQLGAVKSLIDYYLALTGVGEIVARGRTAPALERMANVWVYAIETAEWPPTDEVRQVIRSSLPMTYNEFRSTGGGISFDPHMLDRKNPPLDHPYWSLRALGVLKRKAESDAA